MTVLQVAGVSFGYGANQLFRDVTFSIAAGERAALVAPNGAGKSTLLRLVAGELSPDAGQVVRSKGASVAYYRQSHELSSEGDVLDAFMAGFAEVLELRHRLTRAHDEAASGRKEDLDRLATLMDAYHAAHGDELERKVTILAEKLGFTAADMARPVSTLSGGERGRLLLGVVLAREPEILLLDEPTNHLDLDTISWLEGHLRGYGGALLLVSHDRAFLDAVTTETFELGRTSFRVYPVAYSAYEEQRAADLERERELAERQEAFVAKTEDFIRRNIAGQATKQAQSRRKMLEKLERLDNPEDVWARAEKVAFRFVPAPRTGDIVIEAKGLEATRGERRLFSGVDLLIRRGERVGIIGPNGAGKSTLLKMLAGRGLEGDRGSVKRGTNLCEGYFDQHLGNLDEARSCIDEIRSVKGDMNVDATRAYLARFRFYGDDPFRAVSGLSGGERSRLSLAKLLLEPRNLLFLDEPTNHLDIPAAKILEEALSSFEGTVLLVSHDRRFLEAVATRLVIVRDGAIELYAHGYRDWAERGSRPVVSEGDDDAVEAPSAKREAKGAERAAEPAAKKAGRAAFEEGRERARAQERKKRRVKELEQLIAEAEGEQASLRAQLREGDGADWEALAKKADEEQALSRQVEELMEEWSVLSDEIAAEEAAGGKR